jgi:hypothetical protein
MMTQTIGNYSIRENSVLATDISKSDPPLSDPLSIPLERLCGLLLKPEQILSIHQPTIKE